MRWLQTGYIYHYAFAMILGVFVLMTYFVWPVNRLSVLRLEQKNKNMGLLSLAIWLPIVFGAVLLALGRDDARARACAGSR